MPMRCNAVQSKSPSAFGRSNALVFGCNDDVASSIHQKPMLY